MYTERPEVEVVVKNHAPDCIANRDLAPLGAAVRSISTFAEIEPASAPKPEAGIGRAKRAVEHANAHNPDLIEKQQAEEQAKNTQTLLADAVEKI